MKKGNFVEETELIEQWERWKETHVVSDELASQIMLIAHHLLDHTRFNRYP